MADCYHAKDVIVYCMVSNGKPPRSEMPDAYRYGALLSQNLSCMFLHLYLFGMEDASDAPLLICNKRGAEGSHSGLAIHLLFTVSTQFSDKPLVLISYKREGQVVALNKLFMAGGTLRAHAHNGIALREKRLIVVAKVTSLVGASRC